MICAQVADVQAYLEFAQSQVTEYLMLKNSIRTAAPQQHLGEAEGLVHEAELSGPRVVRRLLWVTSQTESSIAQIEAKMSKLQVKIEQHRAYKATAEGLLKQYNEAGLETSALPPAVQESSTSADDPVSHELMCDLRGSEVMIDMSMALHADLEKVEANLPC